MEQAQVIWDSGVYLATRYKPKETVLLWQIDSFYAEIYYDGIENEIIGIKSFLSTKPLEPYLKQIDLTHLL